MIIDGRQLADEVQNDIGEFIRHCQGRPPCLAVVLVGENPPSRIYVNRKVQACESHGLRSLKLTFPETITEIELLSQIQKLNNDPTVDGILVQLPLPMHISPSIITETILPEKDVDGFHPINLGKLLAGDATGFIPCTPLGIKVMLDKCSIETEGKRAVILGRSNIVGKPMAALLMQTGSQGNATVTIAHRHTKNLAEVTQQADILIVAIGKPQFVTEDMVKEGAAVFDVGINKVQGSQSSKGSRIVGDVDFHAVKDKCSYITPVPGGVGPMTIAMLLHNTLKSYRQREGI